MSHRDTLDKAYGNIPKEIGIDFNMDWLATPRGIRYYWLILVRKFTR